MSKLIEPHGKAKNDFEIFKGIARTMGLEQDFTEGKSQDEWQEWIFEQTLKKSANSNIAFPTYKDFLKKVKSTHPTLTNNDLRLCAYLRLNLSSKDIAPLLNISLSSVEIKRYRLRKKMQLTHDEGLTDHLLSL